MIKESTKVATKNGSIYIKRLCKHFAHKVPSEYSENEGHTQFPVGDCLMKSDEHFLYFYLSAETEENLAKTKAVLVRHLHKFSRKEELAITWEK